ncbi:DEP domain-containing protein [Leptolyngbya sp. CCY15150]|uniref:DEP domain-containing protein n=1 Tax=Leptolyngbya sp. CCY15150 TaxID=2767772 RepID=UPI00194EEC92|nr:DEP domain-containing protein [Leptolyngbya sp. CCY15150]
MTVQSLRSAIPGGVVALALGLGFVKMLAALSGYGDIPLLNRSVTLLLCIGWGVAASGIVLRLRQIVRNGMALLIATEPDPTQLAQTYEDNLRAIAQAMAGEEGIPLKKHRYRLNLYPKSFTGAEAVTWLVRHHKGTRLEATRLGEALLERNYIHSVADLPFQDSDALYQFETEALTPVPDADASPPPLVEADG